MARQITVFASNLQEVGNSLKIWSRGVVPVSVTAINVFYSEPAGQLADLKNQPGTIDNIVVPEGQVNEIAIDYTQSWVLDEDDGFVAQPVFVNVRDNANAAHSAVVDMESDGVLSVAEKTTWRSRLPDMLANYIAVQQKAQKLGVNYTAMADAYTDLVTLLDGLGYKSDPDNPATLTGTELSDATKTYYEELAAVESACMGKTGADAIKQTKVWVQDENTGFVSLPVFTDVKTNAETANTAIVAMESDGILSVAEKVTWRTRIKEMEANYDVVRTKAGFLGVSVSLLVQKWEALNTLLNNLDYTLNTNSNLSSPTELSDTTAAYYTVLAEVEESCTNMTGENTKTQVETWCTDTKGFIDKPTFDPVKENADNAINAVKDMESDGKLTPAEKLIWRNQWEGIMMPNYDMLIANMNALSVGSAYYTYLNSAKTALYNYLVSVGVWEANPTTTAITNSDLSRHTENYYEAFSFMDNLCKTSAWCEQNADVTTYSKIQEDVRNDPAVSNAQLALGPLALAEKVEAAMLGETIIQGGYINSDLLDIGEIVFSDPIQGTMTFTSTGKIVFTVSSNYIYGDSNNLILKGGTSSIYVGGTAITINATSRRLYGNGSSVEFLAQGGEASLTSSTGDVRLQAGSSGNLLFKHGSSTTAHMSAYGLVPGSNNTQLLGNVGQYWKECRATKFITPSQTYLDTVDDLGVMAEFKPTLVNGEPAIDSEGLQTIDVHSLPEFLVHKEDARQKLKADNGDMLSDQDIDEMLLDPDEAGWLIGIDQGRFSALTSGAVRQMDIENKEIYELIFSRLTALENENKDLKQRISALEGV